MGRQKELVNRCGEMLHIRYRLLRQALAECLGTLILVMFGCGSVAQVVLSRGTHGGFLTINLAFGFAVTLGILIAGQVSGAHLNPAVTFAMCFLAREPWIKLPIYTLAQTLGAFLGAGIVFGLYYVHRHSLPHRVCSGHCGPLQQPRPPGPGGLHRGPGGSGHRHLHGLQLWLRCQPCPGLRPPPLHRHRRLGLGSVHDRPPVVVGAHRLPAPGLHCGSLRVPAHDRLPPGAASTLH
ncbi:PREDICTED: aquaporin-3 isoform X2 [Myotis brandtii]|uniref:aquaporin-3 isoform X2 n=1 Tax=Myotis brandtii TaxID=109478 RepID=UPI0007044C25|nr:PREDICTED: aquaporin-3 isoform X2 [Myotis brandtii]